MKTQEYDILVIGAGPSGSSAAFSAADKGWNVLIIERKPVVGIPVRCAEYIPSMLLKEIDIGKDFIVQSVKGMRTILPDGYVKEIPAPGFIIRRDIFDQSLARKAERAGTVIRLGTRAISLDEQGPLVRGKGETYRVNTKVIIGADGTHTRVGRWIDSFNRHLLISLQVTAHLVQAMDFTEVYFDKEIFGGYGWLFPKGNKANIGIGIRKRKGYHRPVKETLDRFIDRLRAKGKITGKITGHTAGWIPAERPRSAVWKNIMLVGDAAGQTHPISGAGVAQAVICGGMAGKWAARALRAENIGLLSGYDRECWEFHGESQEKAFNRRELMEREWDHLDDIIKRCWIGFREYYEKTV